MICKKDLVLFLFPHRAYVLDICSNRIKQISKTYVARSFNAIFLPNFSLTVTYMRRLHDIQIVILMSVVVLTSVGVTRVDYIIASSKVAN